MPYELTKNFYHFRQKPLYRYVDFRYGRNFLGKGVSVVWGIKRDGSVDIQSIAFNKKYFTVKSAINWLKKHKFKYKYKGVNV